MTPESIPLVSLLASPAGTKETSVLLLLPLSLSLSVSGVYGLRFTASVPYEPVAADVLFGPHGPTLQKLPR